MVVREIKMWSVIVSVSIGGILNVILIRLIKRNTPSVMRMYSRVEIKLFSINCNYQLQVFIFIPDPTSNLRY